MDFYVDDVCIILIRNLVKKVTLPKKKSQIMAPPLTVIDNNIESSKTTSTITNSSSSSGEKRKKRSAFKFAARKLSTCLHAPIETQQRTKKLSLVHQVEGQIRRSHVISITLSSLLELLVP